MNIRDSLIAIIVLAICLVWAFADGAAAQQRAGRRRQGARALSLHARRAVPVYHARPSFHPNQGI